jgi:hypothetical protein
MVAPNSKEGAPMGESIIYVVSISEVRLQEQTLPIEADALFPKQNTDGNGSQKDRSSFRPPLPRNAWLFQSNPVLYDLRGALCSLREQVWSVSRYAKEIRTGDRVYLWEAGRAGGVAGIAEIAEPTRLQSEPPEQLPFARVPAAFAAERPRARLRIRRVLDPVIPRQSILSNPELSGLGVLRCARGTNFRLHLDQWQALNALIACDEV